MASLGDLVVKIGGDTTGFDKSIEETKKSIGGIGESLKSGLAIGAGIAIFETISQGFKDAIGMGWKFNSLMEQNLASFTTMMGGSEAKAREMVDTLTKMASITPFETTDLTRNASLLMGFGIEASKVEKTLKMLGDASQGNVERFNSLTLAFAQVSSAGKLTGGDLIQFVNAGFNPLQQMVKTTGKDMTVLKDEMAKGAISAQMVNDAFISATSSGGLFYGAMDKQSKTFEGQMSTLKDSISMTFGTIMKPLFDWASTVGLPAMIQGMSTLQKMFTNPEEFKFIAMIKNEVQFLTNIINSVKGFITEFLKILEGFWNTTKQNFGNTTASIIQGFNNLLQRGKESFNNIVLEAKKMWEAIDNYVVTIVGVITGLYLPALIKMAIQTAVEIGKTIASWALMSAKAVANATIVTVTAIPQILKSMTTMALQAALDSAKVIASWTAIAVSSARNSIVVAVNAAKVVAGWVLMATQSLLQAGRMAAAWFIALGPIGWISGAVVGLVALIIYNWDKVKKFTSDLVTNIVSNLKKFGSYMSEVGKNLVQGLWNGINNMSQWIKTKITEFVTAIGSTIKEFFGIASPSKLTTEYGENISEGLAIGIKNKTVEAKKSAQQLSGSVKEEFEKMKTTAIDNANKMNDIIIGALKKQYSQKEKLATDSLNKDIERHKILTKQAVERYEKEYDMAINLLDDQTKAKVNELKKQINDLNEKTQQEEKTLKEQAYATKISEFQKSLAVETNEQEKSKIRKEMTDFIAEYSRQKQLEMRSDLINNLQKEIEKIQENASLKKNELEKEFNNKKLHEQNMLNVKLANIDEEMKSVKAHFENLNNEETMQATARKLILDNNNKELLALLNNYAPNWKDAGKTFGEKLLEGLNDKKKDIQQAVSDMMTLVGRVGTAFSSQPMIGPSYINSFNPPTQSVVAPKTIGSSSGSINVNVQLDGRTIAKASAPAMVRELKLQGVT